MSDALGRALERERRAILSGDFAALPDLLSEKERLLATTILRPEVARRHARQMRQNQRFLLAAIEGMKDARVRLDALDDAQSSLRVYGADGAVADVKGQGGSLERKA